MSVISLSFSSLRGKFNRRILHLGYRQIEVSYMLNKIIGFVFPK